MSKSSLDMFMHVLIRTLLMVVICAYVNIAFAETKEGLHELVKQLVPLLAEKAALQGKSDFDSDEVKKELAAYIDSLPNSAVDETAQEFSSGLSQLRNEISALQKEAALELAKPANEKAYDQAKAAYETQLSQYKNELSGAKRLKQLFETNPFWQFDRELSASLTSGSSFETRTKQYQNALIDLKAMQNQLRGITSHEIDDFLQLKETFAELSAKKTRLESVNQQRRELVEKFEGYKTLFDRYGTEANYDCSVESIDYSCGNRCETRVKDPIFGTYNKGVDRNCLRRCQAAEDSAKDDLSRQVANCRDERDEARRKLGSAESEAKAIARRADRLQEEANRLQRELETLTHGLRLSITLGERLGGYLQKCLKEPKLY